MLKVRFAERYRLRPGLSNKPGRLLSHRLIPGEAPMPAVLRLYEDILSNGAKLALPALPRMIFVVHGSVTAAERALSEGEAWQGESTAALRAGEAGAACWRWELTSAEAADGA